MHSVLETTLMFPGEPACRGRAYPGELNSNGARERPREPCWEHPGSGFNGETGVHRLVGTESSILMSADAFYSYVRTFVLHARTRKGSQRSGPSSIRPKHLTKRGRDRGLATVGNERLLVNDVPLRERMTSAQTTRTYD